MELDVLWVLLGAFSNRYRGGFLGNYVDKFTAMLGTSAPVKVLKYLVGGLFVNALLWSLGVAFLFKDEPLPMVLALSIYSFIIMIRFSAPGWGDYIGAAIGQRTGPQGEKSGVVYTPGSYAWRMIQPWNEVDYIDAIIKPFQSKPRVYGILGLSIRFFEWSFFLSAPFAFISPWCLLLSLSGLLVGPLTWALSYIIANPWPLMEALTGAAYFLALKIIGSHHG